MIAFAIFSCALVGHVFGPCQRIEPRGYDGLGQCSDGIKADYPTWTREGFVLRCLKVEG